MAEQTILETPEVKTELNKEQTQETKNQTINPEVKEVDLITRVSQVKEVKKEKVGFAERVNDSGEVVFNSQEIDNIKTPEEAKIFAEKAYKSFEKGYDKKYQEVAELRRKYERQLAETSNWTPERLQQELNKPDFVQAAQTVLKSNNPPDSGVSDDKWSSLSEAERTELSQLKQKISSLEQGNWEAVKAQQDAQLKNKYVNYAPDIIDTLTTKLIRNEVRATREDLWKVIDYEPAVKRAYDLGKLDKLNENKEKVIGMSSFDTGRNMVTPNTIQREKGETIQDFMKRSYAEHTKKT